MFVVRAEQFAAFEKPLIDNFVERATRHIEQTFPIEYETMGEADTKEFVRYGIECAAAHGINAELYITQYIELMYLFGHDFDENPDFPWATEILNDPTIESQEEVMDHLCEAAKEVTEQSETEKSQSKDLYNG